jgi:signal transduction histidine kinase
VIEEFQAGLVTLSALSGDVRRPDAGDYQEVLLGRPLGLRGVTGSALVAAGPSGPVVLRAVGASAYWERDGLPDWLGGLVGQAVAGGRPRLEGRPRPRSGTPPFAAVIPLGGHDGAAPLTLVVVGDVAAPFAALGDGILAAVGEQIGSGLEHAELYRTLAIRTADLERLSTRMITEHEDQRRRLGRELHDETAQVFSALKLQLGTLREAAPPQLAPRFDRLVQLVDVGTRSIRSVTEDLRPAVLDDLGLVPAVRALIGDFREWSGLEVDFSASAEPGRWSADTELALFRSVQEALSNVVRHAQARRVVVSLTRDGDRLMARVADDGIGLGAAERTRLAGGPGRSGLFGLRERITGLGGAVTLGASSLGGLEVAIWVPAAREAA